MDTNHTGSVTMQQWFPFMMQVGIDQNQAQNLWWQSDADRSGTLSQQEFLNLCSRPEVAPRIQQLEGQMGQFQPAAGPQGATGQKLFDHIDLSDGQRTGHVTFQQFLPYILQTGIDQNTAQQLWWQTDADRSGTLSQQEFLNLCSRPDVAFRIQQVESQLGQPGAQAVGGMPGGGFGGPGFGGPGFGARRNVIWGCNAGNEIYMRVWNEGGWKRVDGSLKAIAVSHDGLLVWGVNAANEIYARTGITPQDPDGSGWQHIGGSLEAIAATTNHVIGCNTSDEIYSRGGIQVPQNIGGANWARIDGALNQIALGPNGELIGCNAQDNIYWRNNASLQNPHGDGWKHVDGALVCVAVGQNGYIIGCNRGQDVYHRANLQANWEHDRSGPATWIATTANGFTVKIAPDQTIHWRIGAQAQWQQMDGALKNVSVGCI